MSAFPRLVIAIVAALTLTLASPLAAAPHWTSLGPFGGDVDHLTVDPVDARVVYATLGPQGTFKSVDRGVSWIPILGGPAAGSVAVDPTHHTTIYQAIEVNRVLKSTDGGAHWTPGVPFADIGLARELAVDPAAPSRIYLATSEGVWHSLDGGVTWLPSRQPLPEGSTRNVRTVIALARPAGTVFAGTDGGLFKSVDFGETWKIAGHGLPASGITALVRASRAGILWAAVAGRGTFFSPNGGTIWKSTAKQPAGAGAVTSLAISPDARTAWAGTAAKGVSRTTDAGAHWSAVALRTGASVTSLALGGSTLYAGLHTSSFDVAGRDPGGVVASNDSGNTWQLRNRGLAGLIVDMAIDPRDPKDLWATTSLQGVFRSPVGGLDWDFVPRPPVQITADPLTRSLFSAVFSEDGSALYVVAGHRLWKTVDEGASWSELKQGSLPFFIVDNLITDPRDPDTLYVPQIQTGLAISHDAGATFQGQILPLQCQLVALAAAASVPTTLFAGGADNRAGSEACDLQRPALYRSADGGDTWTHADAGLDAESTSVLVRTVAVDPADPRNLYAGLYQSEAVWKSADGGDTWSQIDTGLDLKGIPIPTVSPLDGSIWVTDGFQVIVSRDAGVSWESLGAPQSNFLFAVVPDPRSANRVYVTGWGGVWLLDLE